MTIALNALSFGARPIANFFAHTLPTITIKVIEFARIHFALGQWSWIPFYGLGEIIFGRIEDVSKKATNEISLHLNKILVKTDKVFGLIRYNIAHGVSYIASGILGGIAAVHHLRYVNIGSLLVPFELLGNCLFGFASLISLVQNIRVYIEACKVPPDASLEELAAAELLKNSATMGIISSLSYIITAALLIIGAPAAAILVFGILGITFGCIKILYDYFQFPEGCYKPA